jgi:hypothetical protein
MWFPQLLRNFTMSKLFVVAFFATMAATFAAPALASGYGPAPHYSPLQGAPASQRGTNAQTIANEQSAADLNLSKDSSMRDARVGERTAKPAEETLK